MVDVSVVIVNFNAFSYLYQCIASIRMHTKGICYELIIVDNCSTEGDIYSVIQESSNLKIIKNNVNMGFGAANNKGASLAVGRYILYLNNDTLFLEDTLSVLTKYCDGAGSEQLIGCKVLNADRTLQESIFLFPRVYHIFFESLYLGRLFPKSRLFNYFYQNNLSLSTITETEVVKGCFIFIARSANAQLKGFDEDFYFYTEETDLCRRFSELIGKVKFYPMTSIIHYGEVSTGSYSWFKFQNVARSRIVLFKKWYAGITFPVVLVSQYLGYILRFFVFTILGILKLNRQNILKGYFFFKMLFVFPKGKFVVQK